MRPTFQTIAALGFLAFGPSVYAASPDTQALALAAISAANPLTHESFHPLIYFLRRFLAQTGESFVTPGGVRLTLAHLSADTGGEDLSKQWIPLADVQDRIKGKARVRLPNGQVGRFMTWSGSDVAPLAMLLLPSGDLVESPVHGLRVFELDLKPDPDVLFTLSPIEKILWDYEQEGMGLQEIARQLRQDHRINLNHNLVNNKLLSAERKIARGETGISGLMRFAHADRETVERWLEDLSSTDHQLIALSLGIGIQAEESDISLAERLGLTEKSLQKQLTALYERLNRFASPPPSEEVVEESKAKPHDAPSQTVDSPELTSVAITGETVSADVEPTIETIKETDPEESHDLAMLYTLSPLHRRALELSRAGQPAAEISQRLFEEKLTHSVVSPRMASNYVTTALQIVEKGQTGMMLLSKVTFIPVDKLPAVLAKRVSDVEYKLLAYTFGIHRQREPDNTKVAAALGWNEKRLVNQRRNDVTERLRRASQRIDDIVIEPSRKPTVGLSWEARTMTLTGIPEDHLAEALLQLNPKELQIIQAPGKKGEDPLLAAKVGISPSSVSTYRNSALRKLRRYAADHGFVALPTHPTIGNYKAKPLKIKDEDVLPRLRELVEQVGVQNLYHRYIVRNFRDVLRAAERVYGSWDEALIEVGLDPAVIRRKGTSRAIPANHALRSDA